MNSGPDAVDPQRRNELEEEMSRFEQEIAGHEVGPQVGPPMISANTFQMASEQIQCTMHGGHVESGLNHVPQTGPRPRPMMMTGPGQGPDPMGRHGPRYGGGPGMVTNMRPMMDPGNGNNSRMTRQGPMMVPGNPSGLLPTPHQQMPNQNMLRTQQFGSLQPHVFPPQMQMPQMQPGMPLVPPPMPPMPPHMMMGMSSTSGTAATAAAQTMTSEEKKEWESTYTQAESEAGKDKRRDGKKKFIRVAGGTAWEDASLAEWDPNDFRVFVGDLGNEVNDDMLTRVFSKYPSFLKAKVLRDRKSNKTKGYGFVSFKDPNDFIKAMREMNGKYIGNRPCKLRKSTWRDRNVDIVKKKQKEKKKLGLL